MNTKSIRFRLITGYTGLIIMVVVGFGIYTYFKVDAYLNQALRDSLLHRAQSIATDLVSAATAALAVLYTV